MRLGQDQKEKNKVKEADAKRNKPDYKRAKETGEKKNQENGREDNKREREKSEGQNLRPEKRRKLKGASNEQGIWRRDKY